jgi:hypothetical protein
VPILNRAQRADQADEQWRALDGRPLWAERLGASAYAGAAEAQALARLGFPLVKRPDGPAARSNQEKELPTLGNAPLK